MRRKLRFRQCDEASGDIMAGTLRSFGLVLICALALAACGKKGALETPKSADAPKVEKGQPEPHRPFILDSLLR